MNRIFLWLVLLAIFAVGCGGSPPSDRIDGFRVTKGMTKSHVIQAIGPPANERFFDSENQDGSTGYAPKSKPYKCESLGWGPFGAYNVRVGDVTKHRLQILFVNGVVESYERNAPNLNKPSKP